MPSGKVQLEFGSPQEELRGLLTYRPLPGAQTDFHRSQASIRCLMGGTAAGKTLPATWDLALEMLTGRRCGRLPLHAWVIRPSFPSDTHTDPIYRRIWYGDEKFASFIPRSFQINPLKNRGRLMRLTNGGSIEIRTWGQRAALQQGYEPDIILIDDACSQELFQELHARLLRRPNGQMICAFVDIAEKPWVSNLIAQAERDVPGVAVFTVDTRDNPFVDKQQLDLVIGGLSPLDVEVRIKGRSRQITGRVYREWTEENWRDEEELPEVGTDHVIIDIGGASPCAALWVRRVRPELRMVNGQAVLVSDFWLHREYYKSEEFNIENHMAGIIETNAGLRPASWWIDPWSSGERVPGLNGNGAGATLLDLWRTAARKYGINIWPIPANRRLRRVERFLETRGCVNLSDLSKPNLYALRGMVRLRDEVQNYMCNGLVGARKSPSCEQFTGPNHLLFGMESAVVLDVRYVPGKTAKEPVESEEVQLVRRFWNNFGHADANACEATMQWFAPSLPRVSCPASCFGRPGKAQGTP